MVAWSFTTTRTFRLQSAIPSSLPNAASHCQCKNPTTYHRATWQVLDGSHRCRLVRFIAVWEESDVAYPVPMFSMIQTIETSPFLDKTGTPGRLS